MSIQLVGYNVVIAARQFNPSIFNLLWLVRNELIREDDLVPGSIFTEPLIQINTRQFALVVVPDQLQFAPLNQDPLAEGELIQQLIIAKVGRIVSRLPHTPYTAIGFNFVWHMVPDDVSVRQLTRELFFKNDSVFFRQFDTDDAKFGGYASKGILGCRLRLDIKPAIVSEQGTDVIQFAFNYDKPLIAEVDAVAAVEEMLGHWDEAKTTALRIVESI